MGKMDKRVEKLYCGLLVACVCELSYTAAVGKLASRVLLHGRLVGWLVDVLVVYLVGFCFCFALFVDGLSFVLFGVFVVGFFGFFFFFFFGFFEGGGAGGGA